MRTATNDPQRTCILSGKTCDQAELIRLALSPSGAVVPDVGGKAQGRGAWLGVGAGAVRAAQANGKLRGALARAFKGGAESVPQDLAAEIESGLAAKTFSQMGMAMKSGRLVLGFERLQASARSGALSLLLHAGDAGDDGTEKLDRALQNGKPGAKSLKLPADRARLSVAVGQGNVVHVGVSDAGAAARIEAAARRWLAFCGLEDDNGAARPPRSEAGGGDEAMRRTV